jgi:hypothetical protein
MKLNRPPQRQLQRQKRPPKKQKQASATNSKAESRPSPSSILAQTAKAKLIARENFA